MQIMEWMKHLQDFRAQLEAWGVTAGGLIAVGLIAFFLFLLSAREVMGWFLKTGGLREEVRGLREEVARLQATLDAATIREPEDKPKEKVSAKATGSTPSSRTFRLEN